MPDAVVHRYPDDLERPLLDPVILISAVWRYRLLIVATTILGAVAGVLLALSTPHEYYAENRLFIDPREIRLTENDPGNQYVSTDAMIALTDSQVEILSSNIVLSEVVDKLGLERDPEFNGSMPASGFAAGIALIRDLIRGEDSSTAGEQEALRSLHHSLSVSRDPKTFVVNVGVTTRDPEKSALLANTVVETYLAAEGQAQSNLMERTSGAIDTRIDSLQADLNAAERAVEDFKAQNGLIGVGGQLLDDKQVLALTEQLAAARAQKVAVKVKADGLARAKFEDVLVGAFPEEFLSATLIELRKQYAQSKANADALGTRLGPLHPQYVAALSSLESIRNEIRAELRRIVASSQAELQRAVETEQELASQLAVSKNRTLDNSVELVTLRELERKAAATREIYEAFLKRSRETSERGNLSSTRNMRVISPAEPPLDPVGPSRKIIAIGSTMAGAAFGTAFALAIGAIASFRAQGFGPGTEQFPRSPGGFPGGPRPFSGGPARQRAMRKDGEGRENPPPRVSPYDEASIRAEADLVAAKTSRTLREAPQDDARAVEAAAAEAHPTMPDAQPGFAAQGPVPAWLPPHWHPAYGMMPAWPPVPYGYHPAATDAGPHQVPYAWPPASRPNHRTEMPAESEIARIREDMRRLRTRIGRHAFRRPA